MENRISTEGSCHVYKSNFAHDLLPARVALLELSESQASLEPHAPATPSPMAPLDLSLDPRPRSPSREHQQPPTSRLSCVPRSLAAHWVSGNLPRTSLDPSPWDPPPSSLAPDPSRRPVKKKTKRLPDLGLILPNPFSRASVPSESPEPRATPRTACQHPFPLPSTPPPGPLPPSSLSRPLPLSVRGGGAPSPGQREHVSRTHGTPMRKSNAQNHCKIQKDMEPCFYRVFESPFWSCNIFKEDGNISHKHCAASF